MLRSIGTVALAFTIMFVNNGFIIAGLTSFDTAMLADLGISIGALKLRDTITIAALGLCVPFAGILLDRIAVRPMIVAGLVSMSVGFLVYRYVGTASQLYLAHVFLGASQALCGLIAHVVLVSRWTGRRRGLALGVVVAGSSLGNALVPSINGWLLATLEWRDAVTIGAWIGLALIPLVLLVYREHPPARLDGSPIGLDSQRAPVHGNADRLSSMHPATRRNFWFLGITAGTSVISVLGLTFNLALYVAADLRGSAAQAQSLLFLLFAASTVAQIVAGLAADRVGALVVHRAAILTMTFGTFALVLLPAPWLGIAILVFGFGWGGNSAMLQLQPVALFPSRVLGRTLGILAFMETAGGALAPAAVGYGRDLTGSYFVPFLALCGVMVLSVLCVWQIRARNLALAR